VICCGGVSVYLLADRYAAFATVAQLQKLPQVRARSEGQRLRRGGLSHAFLTPPKILWETPEVTTAANAIYHPRHSYLTRFGVKCHSASRRFRITLWKGHQVAADTGLAVLIFSDHLPETGEGHVEQA
jgi:hypothetical protein